MRRDRRHPLTGRRRPGWKVLLAAALLLLAFAIRFTYVQNESYHAINDAGTYNRMASMIAHHGDYHTGDKPKSGAGGSRGPTAYFPPAYPYYLALYDVIDGHRDGGKTAVPPLRVEMAITGTIAVGLVGLVALEAFGGATALMAMFLAAVYPVFVELTGTLVAEDLVVPLELAALWAMLRSRRATHPYPWLAAAGLLTGLTALTHENAILYLIPFAIASWTIIRRRHPDGLTRGRLRALAAPALVVLACCAMIAPWTIRNAVELHAFVPISDETGITLAGTYNPVSASNPFVPYKWRLFSHVKELRYLARRSNRLTEPQLSSALQNRAIDYIKAHPAAPLSASWHNTLRMFEIENTYAWHASAKALGIHESVARVGVDAFWVLGVLAIAGLFTPLARRGPWWMWAMPLLYWISIVPVNVETPRFREPIDPFFVMLAACALVTVATRAADRGLGLRRAPVRGGRRASQLARDEGQLVKVIQGLA